MSNVWTIGQACVWLATRNAKAAANTSKDAPLLRLQEEIIPAPGYPTVLEALDLLQRRWRDGVLSIDGRKRGQGAGRETIEQGERALLVLEYDGARQEVVAEPERPLGNRAWWGDLAVNADDVQALWPVLTPMPFEALTWWTVPQACIWIATRDARFCEMDDERVRSSLFVADFMLESRADALTGPPLWFIVSEARNLLMTACSRGEIDMVGRRGGIGDQKTIDRFAWSHLEWSERDERDAMALIPPDLDPTAASWNTLRISAGAVRARWPWNQHTAAQMFPPDGLPEAAEISLADAWRWCLFDAAVRHDIGPSRVNWKELGDYIDGKLRNAFLAGRLDCLGRLDPLQHQWSSLPRDWYRLAIEIDPKRNRLVPQRGAEMREFGPAWEAGIERAQDLRVNVDALRHWWVEAMAVPAPPNPATVATLATVETTSAVNGAALPAYGAPWWGIVQAFVWFAFRSAELVDKVSDSATRPNDSIPGSTWSGAHARAIGWALDMGLALNEELSGQHVAPAELEKACADGRLTMYGHEQGALDRLQSRSRRGLTFQSQTSRSGPRHATARYGGMACAFPARRWRLFGLHLRIRWPNRRPSLRRRRRDLRNPVLNGCASGIA